MCLVRNDKGFTVVETVITVSLIALLLLPFCGLLHTALLHYKAAERGIEEQQNLRIAMEAITLDLRKSQGLVDKAANVVLNEKSLLLRTREQEIIWYYLSGQDLRRAIKGKGDAQFQGHNPVAGGITSLTFTYHQIPFASSKQVTVTITGQDELGRSYELRSTVSVRVD